jgi:hypothetical protein
VRSRLRHRRPRSVRTAVAVSAGTALVLAAALVWHGAYAGFSDRTTAVPAQIGTGSLALVDDDSAAQMFTATGLKPGMTGTKCITVSASGSPASVVLYGTGRSSTLALASYVHLTVSVGTGGSTKSCNGFTPTGTTPAYDGTLAGFPTGWGTGVGTWTTTGAAAAGRTYRVVYTLSDTTPNNAQNGTAALTFVWEARTT